MPSRCCVGRSMKHPRATINAKLLANMAVMAPCCYNGMHPYVPTEPPHLVIIVQYVTEVVPPFNHIDGHCTKQLSHFAETAENEKVA